MNKVYNNLDQQKKSDFTEKLRNISPRFLKALKMDKGKPKLTKEERKYWKEVGLLLDALLEKKSRISEIVFQDTLKKKVLDKMEKAIHEKNYLISRLAIYGKIDGTVLLNFLFFNAINKRKLYDLFQSEPDKYGMCFWSSVHPMNLPDLKVVLHDTEYANLLKRLNIADLIDEINNTDLKMIALRFPKSYDFFSKVNPDLLAKNLG